MHHWDTVYESDIAPSPIVRTYRPDPPSKPKTKRRQSSMSTGASGSPESARPRGVSSPRPQARSAGMAERAPRNESLTDLVRFFQTQNAPAESTTALPTFLSPERPTPVPEEEVTKELKPLHRRLLQFTQRQKKETTPKTKKEDNQRQIEALQREGYLLPAAPKRRDSKGSLERTLSRTSKTSKSSKSSKMQDVENIGRPWLDNKGHSKTSSTDTRSRLASLDLSDFGSLVDVAVSMTDFNDPSPPPYQSSIAGRPAAKSDMSVNLTPASELPTPVSSQTRSTSTDPSISSTSVVATQGSGPKSDHTRQPSISSNSSVRIIDQVVAPSLTSSKSEPASLDKVGSSDQSISSVSKPDQSTEPSRSSMDTSTASAIRNPSQHSLKLFPDVAPPRISSKNAWRLSSVPQYQRPPSLAPSVKSNLSIDAKDLIKPTEEKIQKPKTPPITTKVEVEAEIEDAAQCSGALATPETSVEKPTQETVVSNAVDKIKSKPRPTSLALGTLQAFPLPAPTRPLPSIPKPSRAPPATPDKSRLTVQMARQKAKGMDLPPGQPSPIAEDPHEPESQETRSATALDFVGEADSVVDDGSSQSPASIERPHSASPEQQGPRKRASSVRIPKMQDLVESSSPEGEPLADSPVLGQMTPSKHRGKRASRKVLQIDPNVDRKNLPFGLPSPPPSGALPPDPSLQTSNHRIKAQRNITAPSGQSARSLEAPFGPAHHRASMVSRSSSSRSSLRHESIPESYEPSRAESPLPSSDDEGFGPAADTIRPRRQAEKQPKRAHPARHKYDTVDGRTGHTRLRYPLPMRSQTPQGRSSRDLDHLASPSSINSESTYRSREPRSSRHMQQEPNQFLEDRVANLERQNQILQAALLAALNAGVKDGGMMDGLQAALSPLSAAPQNPYQRQSRYQQQPQYSSRPESWVSSSRSSDNSGFETPGSVRDSRANIRQLDNMIEDIEAGWLSDKSSMSGPPRMARNR